MAQYNRYDAYDFERFEPKTVSAASTAPKIKSTAAKKPQLKLVEKPKLSAAQLRAQAHADGVRAFKVFAIAVAALIFMGLVIYSRVQLDELNRDINAVDKSIKTIESDKVRLQMELDSELSIDKIKEYAMNKLDMVEIQNHQVEYINRSSEDEIVKSDGKTNDDSEVINNSGK